MGVIAQLNDREQRVNEIDPVRADIEYVALPVYSYTAGVVEPARPVVSRTYESHGSSNSIVKGMVKLAEPAVAVISKETVRLP